MTVRRVFLPSRLRTYLWRGTGPRPCRSKQQTAPHRSRAGPTTPQRYRCGPEHPIGIGNRLQSGQGIIAERGQGIILTVKNLFQRPTLGVVGVLLEAHRVADLGHCHAVEGIVLVHRVQTQDFFGASRARVSLPSPTGLHRAACMDGRILASSRQRPTFPFGLHPAPHGTPRLLRVAAASSNVTRVRTPRAEHPTR